MTRLNTSMVMAALAGTLGDFIVQANYLPNINNKLKKIMQQAECNTKEQKDWNTALELSRKKRKTKKELLK